MRNINPAWLLLLLLCPLAAWASTSTSSSQTRLIEPGVRLGPVQGGSSLESLRSSLGAHSVIVDRVLAQDGSRVPGAVIYPSDPKRRIELAWGDTTAKREPAWARVRGSSNWWRTPTGVRLGTTLKELEKLNGRAFTVWSFGSDLPGRVRSWNEGALEDELEKHGAVSLKLPSKAAAAQINSLSQGKVLPSGDPTLRRLNPVVSEITITFSGQ